MLQLHDVIKQWLVCNCNPSTQEAGTAKPSFFFAYIILLLVDIIGACHIRRCRLRQIKGYITSKKNFCSENSQCLSIDFQILQMHLAWQQLEYDHVSRDFGKQLGCLVKEEQGEQGEEEGEEEEEVVS